MIHQMTPGGRDVMLPSTPDEAQIKIGDKKLKEFCNAWRTRKINRMLLVMYICSK